MALFRDIVDAANLRFASLLAYWKVYAMGLSQLTATTEAPCPSLLVAREREGFVRPSDTPGVPVRGVIDRGAWALASRWRSVAP